MATYFESVNDFLTVQINDDFSNYALWKKGRCKSKAGPASASILFQITFPLSASGSLPIVVYDTSPYVADQGVLALSQAYSNGVATCIVYRSIDSFNYDTSNQYIDFYVYLPANDIAVSVQPRGLLTMWNESGRVVYDSEANYLKVLDYIDFNYSAASYSKTYPVKKVGVVVARPHWFADSGSGPAGWNGVAGATIFQNASGQPNRITTKYTTFRWISGPNSPWPQPIATGNQAIGAMICDISNLESLPYDIDQVS